MCVRVPYVVIMIVLFNGNSTTKGCIWHSYEHYPRKHDKVAYVNEIIPKSYGKTELCFSLQVLALDRGDYILRQ